MNRSLTFVTGKGGVGKTFVSLILQRENPEAILSEVSTSLQAEALKWQLSCHSIYRFSNKDLAEAFLQRSLKIGFLSDWISENKLFQNLMDLAPNLTELLLMEQWIKLTAESPLIVDAPSTGHFLALFDAIQSALLLFDSGSLRKLAEDLDRFFKTSPVTVCIVSLAEKSSLDESLQIETSLRKNYPNFKILHVLNRKHRAPSADLHLEEPWKSLALRRPQLEEERTKDWAFNRVIGEGEISS